VLRRAGLASPDQYLEVLAKLVKEYLETPGRNRISLEESSLITWIDHYQPFEETPNQSVSYYLKGHLVSMCLDLEIRHQSETRASLETVLRLLWNEYGKVGRGLEEGELLSVGNRATGLDLSSFFDRFVRGTEEVDLALYARYAGLVLAPKAKRPDEADEPEPGDLGVAVEDFGRLARVRRPREDAREVPPRYSDRDHRFSPRVPAQGLAHDRSSAPPEVLLHPRGIALGARPEGLRELDGHEVGT